MSCPQHEDIRSRSDSAGISVQFKNFFEKNVYLGTMATWVGLPVMLRQYLAGLCDGARNGPVYEAWCWVICNRGNMLWEQEEKGSVSL